MVNCSYYDESWEPVNQNKYREKNISLDCVRACKMSKPSDKLLRRGEINLESASFRSMHDNISIYYMNKKRGYF